MSKRNLDPIAQTDMALLKQVRHLVKLPSSHPDSRQHDFLLCQNSLLNQNSLQRKSGNKEPMLKHCQIVREAVQVPATSILGIAKRLQVTPRMVRTCLMQFVEFGFIAMHTTLSRRLSDPAERAKLRQIAEILLSHKPNEVTSSSNPKLNAKLQAHEEWTMRLLADCLGLTISELGFLLGKRGAA